MNRLCNIFFLKKVNSLFHKVAVILILFGMYGCREKENAYQPTPYNLVIPKFFPTHLNIPADNPLTVEGIALGRYLFYDGRLSGRTVTDSMMSCGTCHLQKNSFECGIDHPKYQGGHPFGITGIQTPHVMLPLINLVWNETGYLWSGLVSEDGPDPAKRNIEDIVYMGVIAPHEMDADTNRVKAMIQSIPGYPELFEKAFGSRLVTFRNISKAIAQFIRTLVSSNSKFDRYLRGEEQLNTQELSGYVLFMTEDGGDCFHCHGGDGNPLFTTNLFYNNGKDAVFTDQRDRYSVTRNPADIGAYKATTLRNIELTGPYMHDGRYKTLEEVIDFYSEHVTWSPSISPLMHHVNDGGIHLLPAEKADLIAFIKTLRDEEFLTNPAFSKPALFPDGSSN
ncbi:MAG: cytochrome-c peroxidase [Bacteroidetes bacterium]|nr:cytochrome-c peroxidase [Bacteroidota bacterium]